MTVQSSAIMTTSGEYTPLRSLHLNRDYNRRYAPQVVYSKVATKPKLHHAESWSSDTGVSNSCYIDNDNVSECLSYRSLGRNGSSCSDYGTLRRPRYDDRHIYHPPSTTQSDYGSLQKGSNRDYEFYGRSRPVRTCGCQRHMACDICVHSTPAKLDQLSEDGIYDTLSKDYLPRAHHKELNNNPPPVVKRLKYSGQYSSKSMDYIGRQGSTGSTGSEQNHSGQSFNHSMNSFMHQTTGNYLQMGQPYAASLTYGDTCGSNEQERSNEYSIPTENHYAITRLNSVSSTTSSKSVKFNFESTPSQSSDQTNFSASKKREWHRLRNLLSAVSAIKTTRFRAEKSLNVQLGDKDVKIIPLGKFPRLTEGKQEECQCCEGSAMKCPGSFDRKVQSARSCESLLVAGGGRIPSVDLGEGFIQVSACAC